ncbi:MAG: terpene cyclase/mutase family protein, partial [Planctomycetes bacterium]|nr:terpene cyclase/mutase family protein [Planctomycetota bacterium]
MTRGYTTALLAALACLPLRATAEQPAAESTFVPPTSQQVEESIDRGIDFLLERQNSNGSWGSIGGARPFEVYAPVPGAHHAFRAAVTSLCVAALIETGDDEPEVQRAIDRGEAWMLEHLPELRRATPDVFYNTWGHAYGIQALVKLLDRHPDDEARRQQIREAISQQIELLDRYEVIDGGWAYYDFVAQTQKPSGSSISFVTATVLIAFGDARDAGIAIPERLVQRGMDSIRRQRKPDFSYMYGEYLKNRPMREINRPGGSLGRSQACNLAMRTWGDDTITNEVIRTWLDRLFARNGWLSIGRKRPIPHESWFQVA